LSFFSFFFPLAFLFFIAGKMIKREVYETTVFGYRLDPVVVATVFGVASVLFFILAIVVPFFMAKEAKPVVCAPTAWLYRDSQTVCRPTKDRTYIATADSKAVPYIKYYRLKKNGLGLLSERTHRYKNRTLDLSNGPVPFAVMSSAGATIQMNARCLSGKCENVRIYWLAKEYFDQANETGTYDEGMYSYRFSDLTRPILLEESVGLSSCYYLIFGSRNEPVKLSYDVTYTYTVYDMKQNVPIDCKKEECVFDDMTTEEAIVMDYVDAQNSGPEQTSAQINSVAESYAAATFVAILFLVLTLICLAVLVIFILQKLGKINLFKNKGAQSVSVEDDSNGYDPRYEAPSITVEHVPGSVVF